MSYMCCDWLPLSNSNLPGCQNNALRLTINHNTSKGPTLAGPGFHAQAHREMPKPWQLMQPLQLLTSFRQPDAADAPATQRTTATYKAGPHDEPHDEVDDVLKNVEVGTGGCAVAHCAFTVSRLLTYIELGATDVTCPLPAFGMRLQQEAMKTRPCSMRCSGMIQDEFLVKISGASQEANPARQL